MLMPHQENEWLGLSSSEEKRSERDLTEQQIQAVVGTGRPIPKSWLPVPTDQQLIRNMRTIAVATSSKQPRRTNSAPHILSDSEAIAHFRDMTNMR
jgi:hypothetical protein